MALLTLELLKPKLLDTELLEIKLLEIALLETALLPILEMALLEITPFEILAIELLKACDDRLTSLEAPSITGPPPQAVSAASKQVETAILSSDVVLAVVFLKGMSDMIS